MKKTFQAKDIQKMLGVPRQRYDYLAIKIGIAPDVEEVEGRGKVHLYSFGNAVQFALAHRMNQMGFSPLSIRLALEALSHLDEPGYSGFLDREERVQDKQLVDVIDKVQTESGYQEIMNKLIQTFPGEHFGKIYEPGITLPSQFGICQIQYHYNGKDRLLPSSFCMEENINALKKMGVRIYGYAFLSVGEIKAMVEDFARE